MLRSGRPLQPDQNGNEDDEKHATVTFSTISAPLVLLSTVTLCGLPFFLRVPLGEPTPILLGLRRAVKSLSSVGIGPRTTKEEGRLVVASVEDTSEMYAGALVEAINRMEDDGDEPTEPDLSIIEVNLHGVLYTSKLAMHYFNKQPIGTDRDRCLIITASLAGYLDPAQAPLYQTSKFGVRGLMCNLRRTDRLRVNIIAPL